MLRTPARQGECTNNVVEICLHERLSLRCFGFGDSVDGRSVPRLQCGRVLFRFYPVLRPKPKFSGKPKIGQHNRTTIRLHKRCSRGETTYCAILSKASILGYGYSMLVEIYHQVSCLYRPTFSISIRYLSASCRPASPAPQPWWNVSISASLTACGILPEEPQMNTVP